MNITETGDANTWIIYSGSIISGGVLLELVLVLLMVICRTCQIRRKERIEQEHVYHVRKGERRSSYDFAGNYTSSSGRSMYKNSCVVSEVEPEPQSNVAYNVVTVSPPGQDEAAARHDGQTSEALKPLKEDEVMVKRQAPDAQLKQKEDPIIIIEEPIPVRPNSSYEVRSRPATDKSTRATSNFSTPQQLSLGDQNANGLSSSNTNDGAMLSLQTSSKKTGVASTSLSVDQLEVDQENAYDVLDELQKEIHILSQSIPMLDVFGNEIVKPAAPKISRSIPTLLDMAGYEDLDTVRPHQASKTRRNPATKQEGVNDPDIRMNNVVAPTSDHGKCSPPVTPHTTGIESIHTGAQKKQSTTHEVGENKKPDEPVYSVVQKKPKAFSVSDLTEEPPPVPPMTAEALYTAVQKPKKKTSTRYYSAIITNESLPQLAAHYENRPFKTSISMEQILKEEASKSGTPDLSSVQPYKEGEHFMHPTTVETTYPRTYIYEDELQTDL